MILLFKDCYNCFHFGFYKIVNNNYCIWNTESLYLGEITTKKGTYSLYQVFDKIVAVMLLE